MTIGVKNFRGERLKEARLARGYYKNALGDKIGVSAVAIGRYEDGLDSPQEARLEAIASELKFPVNFFVTPGWPEEIGLVHWRSRNSETKAAREATHQRIKWLCEMYGLLESDLDFPALKLPKLDLPADFRSMTDDDIESAAGAVRRLWGLGLAPIPDVILALENAGIPVATLRIDSDKQDGFYFYSPMLDRAFVGINIKEASCARARFDASHELGHILLHGRVTKEDAEKPENHAVIERQAHRFAGAFLFPQSAFRSEVREVSLNYFRSLKKRWGMSIAAMIMRAGDLRMIDREQQQWLFRNMTYRRWKGHLAEPFDAQSEMPLEQPRMLRRGLEILLETGDFARSSILTALPQPPEELEQLAALEPNFLASSAPVDLRVRRKPSIEMTDLESGNIIEFKRR